MSGRVRAAVTLILLAVLSACATPSVQRQYEDAIAKSAVKGPDAAATLVPIMTETVKAVSWSPHWESYIKHPFGSPLYGETWITTGTHLQDRCSAFPRDRVVSRVEQLLGLPPGAGAGRRIITFEVARDKVFRPCADPAVTTTSCPAVPADVAYGSGTPAADAHLAWLAGQMMRSYRVGQGRDRSGFPFTGLGYTYDWSPDSPGNVGLSEYVVRKGSEIRNVRVIETEAYCAR